MINILKKIFGMNSVINFPHLIEQGAVIIDVRTKEEFNGGHIKGSVNIPLSTLNSQFSKLKKETPVITCCASGIRSASAKSILLSNGFKEVHNGGGWMSLNNRIKKETTK
jgi:rhodanese-related sulfurtransferase